MFTTNILMITSLVWEWESSAVTHLSLIYDYDSSSRQTPFVCSGLLVWTGVHDMSLITLEAHPDLFLSQVQVEAPWNFQEAFLWAVGHWSLALWGLGQPVTHPFADLPHSALLLASFWETCCPSKLQHLRSQRESKKNNEG